MLKHTWGKRIAKFFSMMFVLMLLISTFSVTVFAAETAPADAASMASGAGNVWTFVLATVAAVLLIACIILIYLLKTHKEAYMTKIEELQTKCTRLGRLQKETKTNLGYAEEGLEEYGDWQAKALQIDPQIQSKINKIRYQQLADQFVREYLQCELTERSNAEVYVILDKIMRAYNGLEPEVRAMVECDMSQWEKQYQAVTEEYIKEANSYLVQVNTDCKAITKDLGELSEAIKYYEALPRVIKASVPNLLIGKIREKAASAEMHLPVSVGNGEHSGLKSIFASDEDDED